MLSTEAWIESIGDNPCDFCKYPVNMMDARCQMCCYNYGRYAECRQFLPSMFEMRTIPARGCGKPFLNLAYILKLFGYSQEKITNFIFKEEENK